jgi:single-strand DNA-binding protein
MSNFSLNRVELIGRLCDDPEIRSFGNGGKIAKLRLATSQSWNDKQSGEKRERSEFHTVEIMPKGLAGVIEKYADKGAQVRIVGELRTDKWEDKDGNDRYTTKIVVASNCHEFNFLEGKKAAEARRARANAEEE